MRALRIADVCIGVEADDPGMEIAFAGTHGSFLADSASPEIEIRAEWADLSGSPALERVFDAGVSWRLARSNGSFVMDFLTPLHGGVPYKRLTASRDWSRGRIALHRAFYEPGQPVRPFDYPLDELLMLHYLSQRSGVIVHSCGVRDEDGAGYLFVGHSGAGKTTTALAWSRLPGVTILSDDRVVVSPGDGAIRMHGTPWHGESALAAPQSAGLRAIFLIEHGTENRFARLAAAEAAAELVARSFLPYHDAAAMQGAMSLFDRVVTRVPCWRFPFTPGEAAVDAVRELVRRSDG